MGGSAWTGPCPSQRRSRTCGPAAGPGPSPASACGSRGWTSFGPWPSTSPSRLLRGRAKLRLALVELGELTPAQGGALVLLAHVVEQAGGGQPRGRVGQAPIEDRPQLAPLGGAH